MNKCAVLHIPLSQYAYAEDEHTIRLRLRTQKNDVAECFVYYGDRVAQENPIPVQKIEMKISASDDLFDYYEAVIQDKYSRVCYYFRLSDGKKEYYYYGRGFARKITDNRTEYFQFPYIRREDIIKIPEWVEQAVMYHIFPDSFASGKRELACQGQELQLANGISVQSHLGGTLEGVRENLDYLEELGISCLYLNPVFLANSYHKYDTIDYFEIDDCLGSKQSLKNLVADCHKRGMKVILDGVFNHCGPDFFAFRDVLAKGTKSKYYDWFYYMPTPVQFSDPPTYEAFAYVKEMPKLNTGNPELVQYLCEVGRYWVQEADIDGWRLDVANEINHDFWRKFRKEVQSIKSEFFFIGEIWEESGCWLQGDQFDSTMNYTFSYLCRDFFAEQKINAREFDEQIHKMLMRYPQTVNRMQMNFLDSHDVPRFLSYCHGDKRRLELAMFYMLTMVGFPSIFYGDEAYIDGTTEPEYRAPMPWESMESDFYTKIKAWIELRRTHEALRSGTLTTHFIDEEKGIYCYIREAGEQLLVVINNSEQEINIDLQQLKVCKLSDLQSRKKIEKQLLLQAYGGCIYRMEKE